MKKAVMVSITVLIFLMLTVAAGAVGAEAYGVYDCLSGKMTEGKNIEKPMSIASTTKLMTALVASERLDPTQTVEVKPKDTRIEGSSIYLKAGEKVSVETLLYGLLLESGNDAAMTLARATSGSAENFAQDMNQKAAELGMTGSRFANSSGLEQEGHYSTVGDLCILTEKVLENPLLAEIIRTGSITLEGRQFTNHNKLLSKSEACIGGKTGYTKAAGRCLVSAFEIKGRRVILVTLNDGNDWADHMDLFENYKKSLKKTALQVFAFLPLVGGPYREAAFKATFEVWLLPGEKARAVLYAPHFLYGMPRFGEEWAEMALYIGKSRLETKTAAVCGVRH